MPKDLESLEESRQIRAHLAKKWGGIPSSIFRVDWSQSKNIDLSDRSYGKHKDEGGYADSPFALSGVGARHGDLSRFPQDLGTFLVNFLCPPGGTVLDPFAGHSSRMELVFRAGRNYIGYDISHEFMEDNHKIRQILLEEFAMNPRLSLEPQEDFNDGAPTIELIEGDSRYIDKNNVADFLITSPPFFDTEWYGDELEQLGRQKTYEDFLYSLRTVFMACHRALKPGAFAAMEVNDFRRDGIFHTYHADTITQLRLAGFQMHDVIIVDYGSGFLQAFASDIEAHKIVSKQHSYILIARKAMYKQDEKRQETRERLLEEVSTTPPTTIKQEKLL